MDNQKRLEIMGAGRVADVLLTNFRAEIRKRQDVELSKLLSSFRTGKTDAVTLSCGLAAYCALKDLESELDREVKSGNRIAQEISHVSPGRPDTR